MKPPIAMDDFRALHLAAGQIIHVNVIRRRKRSAYHVRIDFGRTIGERWSVIQATREYTESEMENRIVIALINVPRRRVLETDSEVLILGVPAPDGTVSLLGPSRGAQLGGDVY
jgi:tRNA-binding protein